MNTFNISTTRREGACRPGDRPPPKLPDGAAAPRPRPDRNVTPQMGASGIGRVEGVTYAGSPLPPRQDVKPPLELGASVDVQAPQDGRTEPTGAARTGRIVDLFK